MFVIDDLGWNDTSYRGSNIKTLTIDKFNYDWGIWWKAEPCSYVKGFRPHGLLVYRLCLPPDTPIIIKFTGTLIIIKVCQRRNPTAAIYYVHRQGQI